MRLLCTSIMSHGAFFPSNPFFFLPTCRRELNYRFRSKGYSTDYLFDFSIATDIKNSTSRVIYFDQGHLGMSREYLIKGEYKLTKGSQSPDFGESEKSGCAVKQCALECCFLRQP